MATKALMRWRGGSAALVLLSALFLGLSGGENRLPAEDEGKQAELPADLAKIPTDAVLLLSGRVADVWNHELSRSVREKFSKELAEGNREFEKGFGLRPEQVERLTFVLMDPPPSREDPLVFIRTVKPYERANVTGVALAKEQRYKGQTLFVGERKWTIYPLDAQSVVYGSEGAIHGLIDHPAPKTEGNLAAAVRLAAGKHVAVFALNVKVFNDAVGDKLPGEIEPFKPLFRASYSTLTVDLGEEARAEMKLTFESEKAAEAAMKPARSGLNLLRGGLDSAVKFSKEQKETRKFAQLLQQVQESFKATKVEQQGKTLAASVRLKVDVGQTTVALIEGVQRVREAAARTQSSNNLKQIALAMHNYYSTLQRLPAQAVHDKNGKPLLSWRVMILPYIEQQALYNEFHLNEPWDSAHNKKLLAKMPRIYASPQDEKTVKEHTTHYQGFHGKGAFFEGKQGIRLVQDIPDGTSNTFMIVEATKAVPWTKPEDLPYDPAKPLPKLGLPGAAGFLASMCDGSVRFVSHNTAEKTLRLVIERNDGMPIPADF